jgi:hypothetical protein
MKLTAKLSLLFFAVFSIPLALLSLITYQNRQTTTWNDEAKRLTQINNLKAGELDQWVHSRIITLNQLAQRPLLRELSGIVISLPPDEPASAAAQRSLMEEHLGVDVQNNAVFLEYWIMRPSDGRIMFSTDNKQQGQYAENDTLYLRGQHATYVEPIYHSTTYQQAVMLISTPILDKTGQMIGVLAGRADLGTLSDIMTQGSELSQTEDTYLVNTGNYFVTDPRFQPGAALIKTVHTQGVQAVLSGRDGLAGYQNYQGTPVMGAYRWLPEYQLGILTEISNAEVFASINAFRERALIAVMIIALIAVLIGWLLAWSIT